MDTHRLPSQGARAGLPEIKTVAEFAAIVQEVKLAESWLRKHGFEYTYRPVCHSSSSGRSAHFGNHERGGVRLGCWECGSGEDYVRRVERILNVRMPLDVKDDAGIVQLHQRVDRKREKLYWTQLEGEQAIVDLQGIPTWIAAVGKKGLGFHWRGRWVQWAYSVSESDGGLQLAREGGTHRQGWLVPAWRTFEGVERHISEVKNDRSIDWGVDGAPNILPALALTGTKSFPCPHDVGVLDVDYKPDHDADGFGLWMRDDLTTRAITAGCPVFGSSSGNGRHILWRVADGDGWIRGRGVEKCYPQETVSGFKVEIFPPGDGKQIVIRHDKHIANVVVPVIKQSALWALLEGVEASEDLGLFYCGGCDNELPPDAFAGWDSMVCRACDVNQPEESES